MPKPLRIYVAGPYTAHDQQSQEANAERAIQAGISVFRKGHFPYIPHLTHYVDLFAKEKGIKLTWDDYIMWDIPWLDLCDALLYLGKSKGADLELMRARKLKKRIFLSLSKIPRAKR
jgi:Domain of unknown function (DUF4406)